MPQDIGMSKLEKNQGLIYKGFGVVVSPILAVTATERAVSVRNSPAAVLL